MKNNNITRNKIIFIFIVNIKYQLVPISFVHEIINFFRYLPTE